MLLLAGPKRLPPLPGEGQSHEMFSREKRHLGSVRNGAFWSLQRVALASQAGVSRGRGRWGH